MCHESHTETLPQPSHPLAATCPGCGLAVLFDPAELLEWDDPALRDVMCAWCGTVTPKRMLTLQGAESVRLRRRTPQHLHELVGAAQ
jgi:hypothetical protein